MSNPNMLGDLFVLVVGGIAVAFVGFLGGLIFDWWRSRKGNQILVSHISQSPQIAVSGHVRKRLKIEFDGVSVDQIVLNTIRITNAGRGLISDVEIRLLIMSAEETSQPIPGFFVQAECTDPLFKTTITVINNAEPAKPVPGKVVVPAVAEAEIWMVTLTRPFLNHLGAYPKEKIWLALISNRELKISIDGGGPNWYADYVVGLDTDNGPLPSRVIFISVSLVSFIAFVALALLSLPIPAIVAALLSAVAISLDRTIRPHSPRKRGVK